MNLTLSAACSALVEKLKSDNPIERRRARENLIRIGRRATESLVHLLQSPSAHVRWEAAKTLAGIADPRAASALVEAMDDRDTDVRWVATEAIVALRQKAIQPLMSALTRHAESIQFCQSAHHAVSRLMQQQSRPDLTQVLAALEQPEPAITVPSAANHVLEQLHLAIHHRDDSRFARPPTQE